jgi:hypothetical protein
MPPFDATMTIGHHHLAAAGVGPDLPPAAIAHVARSSVARMPGADWIDVEVQDHPPECQGWVVVYPVGRSGTPDTRERRDHRSQVEEAVRGALVAVAAPF